MRKTSTTLALLAAVASFSPLAKADVTYTFSNLSLDGFEFSTLVSGAVYGTLTGVSVNATLNASINYTYADDLTVYVSPALATGGLLQVGGYSDLDATQRYSWANGGSSAPGTTVIDTVTLTTAITFAGASNLQNIYLGNGYGSTNTSGTWTGSVTLRGISLTAPVVAVPEPTTYAMMLGGLGLAGLVARRRRANKAA